MRSTSSVIAALTRILLFDSLTIFFLGSIHSSAIDRVDGRLASRLELFESLLKESARVFAGAAAFHVGCDGGPEAGVVSVFDFLLSEEEVLVLFVGWVVS